MLGFPELTNAIFFDPPIDPVGCYNIAGTNGFWALYNAAGDALIAAGLITFDTSELIPIPPPSLTFDGETNTLPTAAFGEPQL